MKKFCADAEQIMGERFGKDTIIDWLQQKMECLMCDI